MKIAVAFIGFLACVMALPSQDTPYPNELIDAFRLSIKNNNARFVHEILRTYIENITEKIIELNLDPAFVDTVEYSYPLFHFLKLVAMFQDIHFEGLSKIVSQHISFNIITFTLNLNLYIEELYFSAVTAKAGANIGNEEFLGIEASGSIAIEKPRIFGSTRVRVFPSISVYDTKLQFDLERISSHLGIYIFKDNYSADLNEFFNITVPSLLAEHSELIDKYLSEIITLIMNAIL